ncbi:hypothetical protein PAL_GLEAN10012552 [Pteropus alecto]|uniref:Uncharacterized protein n=1 Tax=Pteropus alecto TaxID=9402 RepID=L5K950_PTEAL|nr:hypothetical protein PAL_GLEAN10012552 [Pteropus alecto]
MWCSLGRVLQDRTVPGRRQPPASCVVVSHHGFLALVSGLSAPLMLAHQRPGSCQRHRERAAPPHRPRLAGTGEEEQPEGSATVRPSRRH